MCKDIDKSIAHTLQSILNTLDKDTATIVERIDQEMATDQTNGKHNMKAHSWVSGGNWKRFKTFKYGLERRYMGSKLWVTCDPIVPKGLTHYSITDKLTH